MVFHHVNYGSTYLQTCYMINVIAVGWSVSLTASSYSRLHKFKRFDSLIQKLKRLSLIDLLFSSHTYRAEKLSQCVIHANDLKASVTWFASLILCNRSTNNLETDQAFYISL